LADQEVVVQKVVEEDQQEQLQMESMELVEAVQREALLEAVQREGVEVEVPIQVEMDKVLSTEEVEGVVHIIMQEVMVEFLEELVVWDGQVKMQFVQEVQIQIPQELVVMVEEVKSE
jgi:hypothetical protein